MLVQETLCNDYEVFEIDPELPSADRIGTVCLSNPQHNDCREFYMKVYPHCIQITLSSQHVEKYYEEGQILFGIDDNRELVSVLITHMTSKEIEHTIFELQAN